MVLFRFPAFFMHYLTESFRPFCIFVPMLEKNEIIQSALQNLKIESLNPMQEAALEQGTGRKDVILLSPTGSGKTLAYLLPLLLTLKPNDDSVQVLILVPSRELALQIDTVFRSMGTSWKTCCCYGGHPIAEEKKSIAGNHPAIIIGTPGRITDHLSKRNFDPETIETLIIDEFDKSLEFGFHTHTEAGTLRLGHQAIAGQGRDRLHLFQRQQSRLHLVQGRFRTLQGSSGRRIYVHIDHTLVLVRDKAGRQHERHAPRGQTEKDQGCVRQHPTVQEPS